MDENYKELYYKEKMRAESLEMDIIAHTMQIKALQDQVNNYRKGVERLIVSIDEMSGTEPKQLSQLIYKGGKS
jgi:hypothetical protein